MILLNNFGNNTINNFDNVILDDINRIQSHKDVIVNDINIDTNTILHITTTITTTTTTNTNNNRIILNNLNNNEIAILQYDSRPLADYWYY